MEPILVVGVGPGHPDYLTGEAVCSVGKADVLFGAPRHLELFGAHTGEKHELRGNLRESVADIRAARSRGRVAVLVSGDPGVFSYAALLRRHFDASELRTIAGISSVQLACARAGLAWHDAIVLSAHGREIPDLPGALAGGHTLVILTDTRNTPAEIARRIAKLGEHERPVWLCERLSYDDERVRRMTAAQAASAETHDLSVVVVEGSDG